MKYRNARAALPRELLAELQKYAAGELLYIPGPKPCKAGWGTQNGSRESYRLRNRQIITRHQSGDSVEELSKVFFLSTESVKKIIRMQAENNLAK